MRILLVEDEALIADAVKVTLERSGHHVDWAADGITAEEALVSSEYDLVVLDLGLPGKDGLSLLKWLRSRKREEAVLILTAREAVENRIEGLDLGADDYLTKPFDMEELMARCRALLRRQNGRKTPMLEHGDICLDPAAKNVSRNGERVELSPFAFQILSVLLERKGRIVSKSDLADVLYGWEEGAESNTVEVYISQIRKRLGSDLIRTLRGVGYVIDKD